MKALLLVLAAACSEQSATTIQSSSVELELDASPTDVTGQFASSSGLVRFAGHAEPGRSVNATIIVGEATIEVAYDARAGDYGTMSFEIAGALGDPERGALRELAVVLDRAFRTRAIPSRLPVA